MYLQGCTPHRGDRVGEEMQRAVAVVAAVPGREGGEGGEDARVIAPHELVITSLGAPRRRRGPGVVARHGAVCPVTRPCRPKSGTPMDFEIASTLSIRQGHRTARVGSGITETRVNGPHNDVEVARTLQDVLVQRAPRHFKVQGAVVPGWRRLWLCLVVQVCGGACTRAGGGARSHPRITSSRGRTQLTKKLTSAFRSPQKSSEIGAATAGERVQVRKLGATKKREKREASQGRPRWPLFRRGACGSLRRWH